MRYWDDILLYGDQLEGLDKKNSPTIAEDFIRKNYPGYKPEDLAASLVYLCPGMKDGWRLIIER